MKTLCLRIGRDIYRCSFDPRVPKNSDEHVFGFTMRMHA